MQVSPPKTRSLCAESVKWITRPRIQLRLGRSTLRKSKSRKCGRPRLNTRILRPPLRLPRTRRPRRPRCSRRSDSPPPQQSPSSTTATPTRVPPIRSHVHARARSAMAEESVSSTRAEESVSSIRADTDVM